MRKTTLKRFLVIGPSSLLVILLTLSLFGRQVGPKPLPWHIAWIAPFGKRGERIAIEWAYQSVSTKQELIDLMGVPERVSLSAHGNSMPAEDVDLFESKPFEIWYFLNEDTRQAGGWVQFSNNEIIAR